MTVFDPEKITFFAKTDARGQAIPFGIKAKDRQRHMYVVGKTGMGKSTLLENMAAQDIRNGEGMAFIDPHGSAAETLLNYVPEHRVKDVVYFAPFDLDQPISFNVMEDVGPDKRHLVVSGLMSTFKKIWVDAWSARMEYILTNALLALIEYPDTTLLSVNRLFIDKAYRERVVDYVKDPAVKSFWKDEFANYTDRFAAEALPAIQNKIGQFTGNPLIRNIIGQPHSSFNIRELMDQQKILIMNLSKGLIGETNANLLGSMLTTRIYLAAMSRADLPVETMKRMPNFYFYVDEFQSFANSTFANILSEARKYHLNLIIAHQYIEQMEEDVRSAVFGNVGTTIAFRVGPFDAEVLETIFAPRFEAADLVNLGFAQIYLTLMIDGIGSQPFSAQTLPPVQPPPVSCRDMVIAASRDQYGKPRAEVEEIVAKLHNPEKPPEGERKGSGKSAGNKRPYERNDRPVRSERSGRDSGRDSGADSPRSRPDTQTKRPERPADPSASRERRDERPPRSEGRRENFDDRPKLSAPPSAEPTLSELRQVLQGMVRSEPEKQPADNQPKPATTPEAKPQPPTESRPSRSVEFPQPQRASKQPQSAPRPERPKPASQPRSKTNSTDAGKPDLLRSALEEAVAAANPPAPVKKDVSREHSISPVEGPVAQRPAPTTNLAGALEAVVEQVGEVQPASQPSGTTAGESRPAPTAPAPEPPPAATPPPPAKPTTTPNEEQPVDIDKIKRMLRQSDRERSPFS